MKLIKKIAVILLPILFCTCAYNDLADKFSCEDSDLQVSLKTKIDATSCRSIDGSLIVFAQGGEPGYDFSVNNGTYQTNPEFINLAPGTYDVAVKDINGCIANLIVEISSPDTNLSAIINTQSDTQCSSNNGSITIEGQGGTAPFLYQLGASGFGTANNFSNLAHGSYSVVVKDNEDCQRVINVTVPRGNTGISYNTDLLPIFATNCNLSGCHGSGTGSRDWTKIENVQTNSAIIKARTSAKTMPIGGLVLTLQEISLIACWVDDGALNN